MKETEMDIVIGNTEGTGTETGNAMTEAGGATTGAIPLVTDIVVVIASMKITRDALLELKTIGVGTTARARMTTETGRLAVELRAKMLTWEAVEAMVEAGNGERTG
jgi:hypothetical protein